eukprot:1328186-Amphidinium_carterae.1
MNNRGGQCPQASEDVQYARARRQSGNSHRVEHTIRQRNVLVLATLSRTIEHNLPAVSTIDELKTFQLSSIRYNGTTPLDISIKPLMGPTVGTWELADWSATDNGANGTLWFDHSISTWMTTSTRCHRNAYNANKMFNTKCMTMAFRQWCDDHCLTTTMAIFLENDGKTIKPQYVTTDNGMEHDHNAATSLHKWHNEDNDVTIFNNNKVKPGGDNGWQWRSPVTIMNSQVTMNIEAANGV